MADNTRATLGATNSVVSAEPCRVAAIRGNWRGAAIDAFIQLHDAKALADVAEGAAPVWCKKVYADSAFDAEFVEALQFQRGCVAVFSTTAATKTIVTGAGNVGDIFTDGEDLEASAITTETSGAAVGKLQVAACSRVTKVEVTNISNAGYVMVFDTNGVTNQQVPVAVAEASLAGTVTMDFGPGLELRACTVAVSAPVAGMGMGEPGAAARYSAVPALTADLIRITYAA